MFQQGITLLFISQSFGILIELLKNSLVFSDFVPSFNQLPLQIHNQLLLFLKMAHFGLRKNLSLQ